jgi:hypothetical protein
MGAVRPKRLAQHGLSRSGQVIRSREVMSVRRLRPALSNP